MRIAVLVPPRFPIKTHSLARRFCGAHFATGCQLKQQLRIRHLQSDGVSVAQEFEASKFKSPSSADRMVFMLTYVHLNE